MTWLARRDVVCSRFRWYAVEEVGAGGEGERDDVQAEFVDQAGREVLVDGGRAAEDGDLAVARGLACWASAEVIPSVTKVNVVPPAIGWGSRAWWVRTNTDAWKGGSSPHQPFHGRSHAPRTGPNMLRPMMNAEAAVIRSISALFSSGVSNIQAWNLPPEPSPPSFPNGRSSVWSGPAEQPSSEIVMSQITLPVGVVTALSPSPAGRGVQHDVPGSPTRGHHARGRSPSPSWQDDLMERVLGIGGYFLRSTDPVTLSAWYRDCLGLDADDNGLWNQPAGPTVFATFEADTDYFGTRTQQTMLNFRVRDLDAILAQLRAKGADVAEEIQDMDGVGRFGWVTDPEGNRVELWQPA